MKTCAFFLGLIFLTACSTSSKETVFVVNEDEVIVKICVNTTKEELANIAQEVKMAKNIDFDYSKTTFSSDGKVDQLDFTVSGKGFKSSLQADLFMSDEYQGFIRDYRKNSQHPFRCGTLE